MQLKTAVRSLISTPIVTLVVALSLGLGIGGNTAIFSLLHQIVLRALPVPEPESLVLFTAPAEFKNGRQATNSSGGMEYIFSYPAFRELEKNASGSLQLAAFRLLGANIASETSTQTGSIAIVSGDYFSALRLRPHLGRLIDRQDDRADLANPVAVLSYGYWSDRLGADPLILNKQLRVNGESFTVVGVAPAGFNGITLGSQPDLFLPLVFKPRLTPGWDGTDRFNDYWLYLFARLGDGMTPERAEAALNGTYAGIVEEQAKGVVGRDDEYLDRFKASRLSVADGSKGNSSFRDGTQLPILILMSATVLVLLIAMANAANLLLARSAQRRKELGVRVALGAQRRHLITQLLTESVLLALAGGLTGVLLGKWTIASLIAWITSEGGTVRFLTSDLQWPVLLFALGVSLVAGVLLGLYPALEASRGDVVAALGGLTTRTSASRGAARVRKGLVVAQVTVSVLLLVPTGLFLKSLVNLLNVDLGLPVSDVVTFRISPDLNGYSQEQILALFGRIEEEVGALPGVTGVTSSMVPLIAGNNWGNSLKVEGYPSDPDSDAHSNFNAVGHEFFSRLSVPLLSGREFRPQDGAGAAQVAVVNETFAKHFFGDENPIGRRFAEGWGDDVDLDIEIVGVVQDTKYSSVKQDPPRLYFRPWRQASRLGPMSFYIRSGLPADQTMAAIRRTMVSIDPDLPVELRTMDEQVADNIRSDTLVLQLSAVFAFLATALAMLGLYGVMSYSIAQRIREIGIRMALGAESGRIRLMVMREMFVILAIGLLIGVPASLGLARLAESQLFGVAAFDLPVILGAVFALVLAAVGASYLPSRRATNVDPVTSLRYE